MTPQQRLDHLLADVWQPTNRLVTISDLELALDDFGFALVRLTLDASTQPNIQAGMSDMEVIVARATAKKMEDAVEAMRSGGGLSLSTPERQAVIDMLATAGQWPDAVRDAVKALGGVYVKEWQRQGMAFEPTLESVQHEIDKPLLVSFVQRITAAGNIAAQETGATRESVLAAIAAESEA